MDGLELSALNDFSDAHGKSGLLEGNRSHEQRAQGWAVLRASQTCQHPDTRNHTCQLGSKAQILQPLMLTSDDSFMVQGLRFP